MKEIKKTIDEIISDSGSVYLKQLFDADIIELATGLKDEGYIKLSDCEIDKIKTIRAIRGIDWSEFYVEKGNPYYDLKKAEFIYEALNRAGIVRKK